MFRLCENEGVKMGLYRSGGLMVRSCMGGFGKKSGLNLKGEVGGVL